MDERLREMFEIKGAEMGMPSTLSPEIRGKVVRRRFAYGSVAAVAVAAALVGLFVWSGARDETPQFAPANESEVQQPAGRQLDAGAMEAGRYSIDEFQFAPFSIEVAESTAWQPKIVSPGMFEMAYQGSGAGFMTFFQEFEKVFDPQAPQSGSIEAPNDLVTWMLEHPALDVRNMTELEIDGYPATSFDAEYNGLRPTACGRGCWQFAPAEELWGGAMQVYAEDGPQRVVIVETPKGEVIVQIAAGGEDFAYGPADEALKTVDFVD